MPPASNFDDRVLEAIRLATPGQPQDIAGILHYVDSREKVVLTHRELVEALERLIHGGAVAEVAPFHFCVAESGVRKPHFTAMPREVYDAACDRYVRSLGHAKA